MPSAFKSEREVYPIALARLSLFHSSVMIGSSGDEAVLVARPRASMEPESSLLGEPAWTQANSTSRAPRDSIPCLQTSRLGGEA